MIRRETAVDTPLRVVRDLYEQGLYLQAYQVGQQLGPLPDWPTVEARVMAARLASQLGGMRLADWLIRGAVREAPECAEAVYFHGYTVWRRRGPYPAWRWARARGELPEGASADIQSSWYAFQGGLAAMLRDFDTADGLFRRAEQVAPDSPWVKVCYSQALEFEDRYDEALATARESLARQPWFRPGVQATGHLLTLLDRDEEALDLLSEASARLESAAVTGQLYALQMELKLHQDAEESLNRFMLLSPLVEKRVGQWLAAQRSEIAYQMGDLDGAIRFARESDSEFHKTVAANLQDPARRDARVVTLPVRFVRQHHMTCGPATLSAISRYWSMPADHLQVADEICYNGTSNYHERQWAEDHGWIAREFTVTEESATAMLDRGVPFTLTTVEPGNSHLQAVVGYDGRRGTLLIRDPFWRNSGEGLAAQTLERYRAYGPRGMAMAPLDLAEKLAELELPDETLWDHLHALDGALVAHRRERAEEIYEQMRAADEGHRLTLDARRRIAIYDANPTDHLAAVDQLLQLFPENASLQLERLSCLRHHGRRDQRLAIYQQICQSKESYPIAWQQYAQELCLDARRHDDALWLLRRAIRRWPTEAANYFILANLYWDQRQFDQALELYRFAACLGDKDEQFAHAYFTTAIWFKQTESALQFLHERFRRFGVKSSLPARTLVAAYMQLDRMTEALDVLEQALAMRPDDGQLLLHAADIYVACSSENSSRAMQLLEQAKDNSPPGEWLRTAARLASSDGRLKEALERWRAVLAIQPLAIDAHAAVARLLAETAGRAAALEHLRQSADLFPHHHPLHELWIEWLRDEPPEIREPVIRRVVELNPDSAWVRRERALLLGAQGGLQEAWEEVDVAGRLEPLNPSYHLVRAHLLTLEGRLEEAKAALRQAVELSVDNEYAIGQWIGLCDTVAERREVLRFVQEQLVQQVIFGDGLLAFREYARGTLDAEEQLALLRDALAARPDLWHAWSATVQQLLDMDRLDEAAEVAQRATERFPLLPRLWLDRAAVCRARLDVAGERESLENAYRINPSWSTAARALAECCGRRGDFARSRELLEHAVARDPLDAVSHLMLAKTLWRSDEKAAAMQQVQEAVQLEPGYEQAWDYLNLWADELGEPERAVDTLRELTERRGGEARSWFMLARVLDDPVELDECLAALDNAVRLNPRLVDAYDCRARVLARAGRWEEAFAACQPPVWNHNPPTELQARAAWLEAERGDVPAAIGRMREVVAQDPHFYGAWSQLADWCLLAGDQAGYLEAAEAMVRISPQYEISLGYLGDARLASGDRAGAYDALRRAFELNPQYEYAGNLLFDLQLEDGDLPGATATMAALRTQSDSGFVIAREIQLAAKRRDKSAALEPLPRLCVTPCETAWPVAAAVEAIAEAGWAADARQILEQQLAHEQVQAEVATQWVRLGAARGQWPAAERLRGLLQRGELGQRAIYAFVEMLREAKAERDLLRFARENEGWLHADSFAWGSIGWGLTSFRQYQAAARWHADWRDQTDAQTWMLVNAVEGLRAMGRDGEAAEASRHALALPPGNGGHLHHLWLAADAVLAGDIESAKEHLPHIDAEPLDNDYQFLETLVRGVIEVSEASADDAARVFRQVARRITAARRQYHEYSQEPARQRIYRKCLRRLAALRGGPSAWLWYVWRWLQS